MYTIQLELLDGVDHGSLEQEFTVSASLRRQCFNITIIDDDVAEEDEFFQVSLTSSYIVGNYRSQLSITTANVTIIDDDSKSIKFKIRLPVVTFSYCVSTT